MSEEEAKMREEEAKAAVKIQAVHRGKAARKELQQGTTQSSVSAKHGEAERVREELHKAKETKVNAKQLADEEKERRKQAQLQEESARLAQVNEQKAYQVEAHNAAVEQRTLEEKARIEREAEERARKIKEDDAKKREALAEAGALKDAKLEEAERIRKELHEAKENKVNAKQLADEEKERRKQAQLQEESLRLAKRNQEKEDRVKAAQKAEEQRILELERKIKEKEEAKMRREEEAAAVKIQAVHRGKVARRELEGKKGPAFQALEQKVHALENPEVPCGPASNAARTEEAERVREELRQAKENKVNAKQLADEEKERRKQAQLQEESLRLAKRNQEKEDRTQSAESTESTDATLRAQLLAKQFVMDVVLQVVFNVNTLPTSADADDAMTADKQSPVEQVLADTIIEQPVVTTEPPAAAVKSPVAAKPGEDKAETSGKNESSDQLDDLCAAPSTASTVEGAQSGLAGLEPLVEDREIDAESLFSTMKSSAALSVSEDDSHLPTSAPGTAEDQENLSVSNNPSEPDPKKQEADPKTQEETLGVQPKSSSRNSVKGDQPKVQKSLEKVPKRMSVIGLPSMTKAKSGLLNTPKAPKSKASSLQLKPPSGSHLSPSAASGANLTPGSKERKSLNVRRATMLPDKHGKLPAKKEDKAGESEQKVETSEEDPCKVDEATTASAEASPEMQTSDPSADQAPSDMPVAETSDLDPGSQGYGASWLDPQMTMAPMMAMQHLPYEHQYDQSQHGVIEVPSEMIFHLLQSGAHLVTNEMNVALHPQTADVLYSSQEYRNIPSAASGFRFTPQLPAQIAVPPTTSWTSHPVPQQACAPPYYGSSYGANYQMYSQASSKYPSMDGGYVANDGSAGSGYGYAAAGECEGDEANEESLWEDVLHGGMEECATGVEAGSTGAPEEASPEVPPELTREISEQQLLPVFEAPQAPREPEAASVHAQPSPRKALWKPKTLDKDQKEKDKDGHPREKEGSREKDSHSSRKAGVPRAPRSHGRGSNKEATRTHDDFFVVTTGSSGGSRRRGLQDRSIDEAQLEAARQAGEEGVDEAMAAEEYGEEDAEYVDGSSEYHHASSGSQIKSVQLLRGLNSGKYDVRVPPHSPVRPDRSEGNGEDLELPISRPHTSPVVSHPYLNSLGRPKTSSGATSPKNKKYKSRVDPSQRMDFDQYQSHLRQRESNWVNHAAIQEQCIPQYDALMDHHCNHLSHPDRLRHLMETRELPEQYMFMVRNRLEQYRDTQQVEDFTRARPVPQVNTQTDSVSSLPPPLMEKLDKLAPEKARALKQSVEGSKRHCLLLCNTDWYNSGLRDTYERHMHQKAMKDAQEKPSAAGLNQTWSEILPAGALEGPYQELREMCKSSTAHQGRLSSCWYRLKENLEALWTELRVPELRQRSFRDRWQQAITPESYHKMLTHAKEMLDYREATLQVIHKVSRREKLMEQAQQAYAVCINDPRLTELDEYLLHLDRLGVTLVRAIGVWAQRFGHLALDMSQVDEFQIKGKKTSYGTSVRPIFVWGGRDYLEIIQTDGDVLKQHAPPGGSALVGQKLRGKSFGFNDPLFVDGPPPVWYDENVMKMGLKVLKSPKKGEGDLRFKSNQFRKRRVHDGQLSLAAIR